MPLITDPEFTLEDSKPPVPPTRKQSQHSMIAKTAIFSNMPVSSQDGILSSTKPSHNQDASKNMLAPPQRTVGLKAGEGDITQNGHKKSNSLSSLTNGLGTGGVGPALTDTPMITPSSTAPSTAPNSPKIPPSRKDSGGSIPRSRPTTLDIPGLTKSKVSPDGRIAQRDIGSKLVIVMVGLPARGKSYVTKKLARYLNWQTHNTRIFNVGERRRIAAGESVLSQHKEVHHNGESGHVARQKDISTSTPHGIIDQKEHLNSSSKVAEILINGGNPPTSLNAADSKTSNRDIHALHNSDDLSLEQNKADLELRSESMKVSTPDALPGIEIIDQSASFFDPKNVRAAQIREQVAIQALDELLDFVLDDGGSVGILDATNSTLERRKMLMKRIRERAGPELNVLFLESLCVDENLLESNMRLKLSGPDYRNQDPVIALEDFKKRVAIYEKNYVPLGDYEEKNDMPYVQLIDVGRKLVSHQIRGFISAQTVYYLLNFNLSARQIWITRHGESTDNVNGKIGGNSDLSENGHRYAQALTRFVNHERKAWDVHQKEKALMTHFPPRKGDTTPPNPEYSLHDGDDRPSEKSFCVWTSMLKRSIQTAEYFDEEEFDIKQMKMLDELNAGIMEGMTYEEIRVKYEDEYYLRKRDKLHYRYPGAGGEGYLDIINRLRPVIVEVERMTDHVLLVGHRSIARVLLAYFMGLKRAEVADLDVPLGMLYMLEPKPYGVEFKAYRYNPNEAWFDEAPDYKIGR
ncbi:MAG: hypothetical protein M1827_002186 [Pycnora praestabilis]|nr:MAG: hypothetical protein M1827_002186 [Pycnora praestabilis]